MTDKRQLMNYELVYIIAGIFFIAVDVCICIVFMNDFAIAPIIMICVTNSFMVLIFISMIHLHFCVPIVVTAKPLASSSQEVAVVDAIPVEDVVQNA